MKYLLFVVIFLFSNKVSTFFINYKFRYLQVPGHQCKFTTQSSTKLLILVKTSTFHFIHRKRVRETWFPSIKLDNFEAQLIFLLGIPDNSLIQHEIDIESLRFGDILQANFIDTYHNLTVKTVMAFKWASEQCVQADFVLVADDDMGISLPNMIKTLRNHSRNDELFTGHKCEHNVPERSPNNKYYITFEEYPNQTFPSYIDGPAMIFSFKTFAVITKMMDLVKAIWLQDVYIGIIAEFCGIKVTHNKHFYIGPADPKDNEKEAWNDLYIPVDYSWNSNVYSPLEIL